MSYLSENVLNDSLQTMTNALPQFLIGNEQEAGMPSTRVVKQKSSFTGRLLGFE